MKAVFVFSLVAVVSVPAGAEDKSRSIIDPEKVTDDYHIQGEYNGMLGAQKFGLQVVALGNDEFSGVAYPGGLPGDGYYGFDKIEAQGRTKDGTTRLVTALSGQAVIRDGKAEIWTDDLQQAGVLERVERKSPTLRKKPPEGAVVLFDGSTADNFERGNIVLNNLLLADCESRQKFGDHSLHLEFRTPYEPLDRGQQRGNSGVYLQGRYEVQILDSFGLEGENNECGGIYSIAKPKVNACFPPLTWQTYDIDFTAARYENGEKVDNARVTVRHNGILIHREVELPNDTPGKNPEAEGPGILYLQGHGNQVVYRNIWVVEK